MNLADVLSFTTWRILPLFQYHFYFWLILSQNIFLCHQVQFKNRQLQLEYFEWKNVDCIRRNNAKKVWLKFEMKSVINNITESLSVFLVSHCSQSECHFSPFFVVSCCQVKWQRKSGIGGKLCRVFRLWECFVQSVDVFSCNKLTPIIIMSFSIQCSIVIAW